MNLSNQLNYLPKNINNNLLQHHHLGDPIFIVMDNSCDHFIKRFGGKCIVWQRNKSFDMRLFLGREIWILYSAPIIFNSAMTLARKLQLHGAAKVSVILVHHSLVKDHRYDR